MKQFEKFQDYNHAPQSPPKRIQLESVDRISAEIAKNLHREMVRLRRMEERLLEEYHPADEMKCPVHFCIGQEAVPAVLSLLLKQEDYLFSHHRSHGFYLAKAHTMQPLFAEMYGKECGANGGKAGSQDVSLSSAHFYSGAILAGTFPIATGVAFALKANQLPYVAVAATGDGSTDEGVTWESLNYAAVKKLPVIFVCENNNYSTYSPQHHRSVECNIAERVQTFGVPVKTFFGNDVVKAYVEMAESIEAVREGKGPVFLETFTYRMNSHVGPESDESMGYRTAEELQHWKGLDPILLLESRMKEQGWLDEAARKKVYEDTEREIDEAFDFAKRGEFPRNAEWEAFNLSGRSPLADKLLLEESQLEFNQNQVEAIPGPY